MHFFNISFLIHSFFAFYLGASLSYGNSGFVPFEYDENSVIFCFHTVFWLVGIKQIIDAIYNGATRITTTQQCTPEVYLKLIKKYRVNIVTNTPFHMIPCLKSDLIRTMDFFICQTNQFLWWKIGRSYYSGYYTLFSKCSNNGMLWNDRTWINFSVLSQ